jgi:hypothetical protein
MDRNRWRWLGGQKAVATIAHALSDDLSFSSSSTMVAMSSYGIEDIESGKEGRSGGVDAAGMND